MVALIQKVRELARRKDPQSTFAGESIRPGAWRRTAPCSTTPGTGPIIRTRARS